MKRLLVVVSLAACGGGGGFPSDAPPEAAVPGGKFQLAWTVTDTSNNQIPCAQIGANFVTVGLRNRALQGGFTEVFSCSSGMSTSLMSFPPGIYDLSFTLGGTTGTLDVGTEALGIEIVSNQTANLTPVNFVVDATGKLEVFVNTGVTGGNCAGGATVDDFTITLTHTGAACEQVTFAIDPGPPNSYAVDCATPNLLTCIEPTQKLSVASLPSGSYRLDVKGKIGGIDCFSQLQTITVPPNGMTLTQTMNLTKLTTAGCPP